MPKQISFFSADASETDTVLVKENNFYKSFVSDIKTFKEKMIIYSPFMTENRLSTLLHYFYEATSLGKRIVVITKPATERQKKEQEKYNKCEEALRNVGVSILHKKGMHEKIIIIDSETIWTGSLNALSFTGNTSEVMERRKDTSKEKNIINSYINMLDITYLIEALEKDYETKCPICGSEMLIAESNEGGIYWKCIRGDFSRDKKQQYPVDGVLRCSKCGGQLSFAMKNEPRWVCKADQKQQKMRKADLKLPKMVSLLTEMEVERVQKYFKDKSLKKKL